MLYVLPIVHMHVHVHVHAYVHVHVHAYVHVHVFVLSIYCLYTFALCALPRGFKIAWAHQAEGIRK